MHYSIVFLGPIMPVLVFILSNGLHRRYALCYTDREFIQPISNLQICGKLFLVIQVMTYLLLLRIWLIATVKWISCISQIVKFLYPSSHTEVNRRAKISNQCQESEHEWTQWKLPKGNLNCSCSFLHKRPQPKLVFGQWYQGATEARTNESVICLQHW